MLEKFRPLQVCRTRPCRTRSRRVAGRRAASPRRRRSIKCLVPPVVGGRPRRARLRFCTQYKRGPERAREQFEADYEEIDGYPTAAGVFDEAAGRC